MRNLKSIGIALALSTTAAMLGSPASANIITSLVSITPSGSGFNWTYSASLAGTQDIEQAVNNGFGTLYDIGTVSSLTRTGLLSTDFSFSQSLTNTAATGTAPTDSASILNLRYIDTTTDIAASSALGTFTFFTLVSGSHLTNFDGQAALDTVGGSDDTPSGNIGFISAPNASATPVPAALPLFASGLLGLWAYGRKRKGKQPISSIPATA